MAFREDSVIETCEMLRAWLAGKGLRRVAEQAGVDRKTARRYVDAAVAAGLVRDGGEDQLTDELLGQVVAAAPGAPAGPRCGVGGARGAARAGRRVGRRHAVQAAQSRPAGQQRRSRDAPPHPGTTPDRRRLRAATTGRHRNRRLLRLGRGPPPQDLDRAGTTGDHKWTRRMTGRPIPRAHKPESSTEDQQRTPE